MPNKSPFPDLIRRVRAGDQEAAAELVERYEPTIRRAVRVRLSDPHLRRLLDSMDICQSVLGNFFVRAASGQFELDRPEQLLKLLETMARNKLKNEVKKQQAARRDGRRCRKSIDQEAELVDPNPSPSQVAVNKELLQELRKRLPPEERRLAEQWSSGRAWTEIAKEAGELPDALRKRLGRALDRVARELGLV